MAQGDWATLNDGLDSTSLKRGVTNGIARPNGGGNFLFGFNSSVSTAGAAGLYAAQVNFAPMAKGGSLRSAIRRGASGGPLNFAPMLFLGLQANSVLSSGYILGLEDDDPHRIVIRKGTLVSGVPAVALGVSGVLAKGTETFPNDTWLHLRLDMIVNTNGDVILQAFKSDLLLHAVNVPSWVAVPGCEEFIDDALGINSGSAPYTSGYGGMAFQTKDVTRRGYFDHIEVIRQV
jgi:hypothetical protein